ncbi:MAG: peroxiredoxin [Thermoplasmata archaeon]|nr:peroxiredoxin [Thermoplasmata archaeon]
MTRKIPREGAAAPAFCLKDQNAKDVCLDDMRGKWVVLYFYPKDDTPGCTTEACDFTERIEAFGMLDATVLGVSPDSIGSHERFIEKHSLRLTLLSDAHREAIEAYGAWGEKRTYGRTAMGVLRSTFIVDPEGRVAAVWPDVEVKGHVFDVQERLEALRAGRS